MDIRQPLVVPLPHPILMWLTVNHSKDTLAMWQNFHAQRRYNVMSTYGVP